MYTGRCEGLEADKLYVRERQKSRLAVVGARTHDHDDFVLARVRRHVRREGRTTGDHIMFEHDYMEACTKEDMRKWKANKLYAPARRGRKSAESRRLRTRAGTTIYPTRGAHYRSNMTIWEARTKKDARKKRQTNSTLETKRGTTGDHARGETSKEANSILYVKNICTEST